MGVATHRLVGIALFSKANRPAVARRILLEALVETTRNPRQHSTSRSKGCHVFHGGFNRWWTGANS